MCVRIHTGVIGTPTASQHNMFHSEKNSHTLFLCSWRDSSLREMAKSYNPGVWGDRQPVPNATLSRAFVTLTTNCPRRYITGNGIPRSLGREESYAKRYTVTFATLTPNCPRRDTRGIEHNSQEFGKRGRLCKTRHRHVRYIKAKLSPRRYQWKPNTGRLRREGAYT